MSRLAVALFVLACCFTASLSAAEPCPTGWKFNSANNHCYNLEATASPVTWVQAKAACAAYNARTTLVTLGDQTENDYVYNYVKTEKAYNGNIWIGLEANDAYAVSGNTTCSNAVIVPVLGRKFSGTIGTGTGTVDPYGDCDMPGKENFFRITPAISGTWTFKVTSVFDAVIDLYSGACTSYIDCEDYYGGNATDTMTRTLTAGQTYTVVVDKYRTTDTGTYTLEIMAPTDNGKRAYSWIDDTDNGYTNWDTNEPSNSAGAEACGELKIGTTTYGKWNDLPCNSGAALHAYVCEYISSICGDNVVEGIEECDDGNLTDGDGCDANCRPTGCGNGRVTGTEQCDDGNTNNNDGCRNNCTFPCPEGWTYNTALNRCYGLYGTTNPLIWTDAKDSCASLYSDSTLVTIGSQSENDFVFNYVKNTKAYNANIWIGLEGEYAYPAFGNEVCSVAWVAPTMGRKYSGYIGTGAGTVDPYGWCDMPGKENFFTFTAGATGEWTFRVYSQFDAVVHIYSGGNCGSYLDCEDYYGGNATDTLYYDLTAGQTYTVVVDKYLTTDEGAYTLELMPPADREKRAYSWIDDTNTNYTNWDSNEPTGVTEGCGEMKIATTTNAKWNDLACNNTSIKLAYLCEMRGSICGDGYQAGLEQCDDSNLIDGDGCDSNCTLTSCGNGIVTPGTGEQCDDGNDENIDDCDNDCLFTDKADWIETYADIWIQEHFTFFPDLNLEYAIRDALGVTLPEAHYFTQTAQSAGSEEWVHYGPFDATNGQFMAKAIVGSGDVTLYVRRGATPTATDYDCMSNFNGPDTEECTISATGQIYVSVKGVDAGSSFTIQISYATGRIEQATANYHGNATAGGWASYLPFTSISGTFSATLTPIGGNADLYVRRNLPPDANNYDCRSNNTGTATDTCALMNGGVFYMGVFVDAQVAYDLDVIYWKEASTEITTDQLLSVTSLDLSYQEISSLNGLQYLPNLTELNASGNEITDTTALYSMTGLVSLDVSQTGMTDYDFLQNMVGLEHVKVTDENGTDITIDRPAWMSWEDFLDHLWDIGIIKKNKCNDHGYFVSGECVCEPGYKNPYIKIYGQPLQRDKFSCVVNECANEDCGGGNGVCVFHEEYIFGQEFPPLEMPYCICNSFYRETMKDPYTDGAINTCRNTKCSDCGYHGTCDSSSGRCLCEHGYREELSSSNSYECVLAPTYVSPDQQTDILPTYRFLYYPFLNDDTTTIHDHFNLHNGIIKDLTIEDVATYHYYEYEDGGPSGKSIALKGYFDSGDGYHYTTIEYAPSIKQNPAFINTWTFAEFITLWPQDLVVNFKGYGSAYSESLRISIDISGNYIQVFANGQTTPQYSKVLPAGISKYVRHFFVMTYDGNLSQPNLKIYLDGVMYINISVPQISFGTNWRFNHHSLASRKIDEIQLYRAVLSKEQIRKLAYGECSDTNRNDITPHMEGSLCTEDTLCSPGSQQTAPCGINNTGHVTRTCSIEGLWGAWGSCSGASGTCVIGTTELRYPNSCGLNERDSLIYVCVDGFNWEYYDCNALDKCELIDPDTQSIYHYRTISCGLNGRGTKMQLCEGAPSDWHDVTNCIDPDECTDGQDAGKTDHCGDDGTGYFWNPCIEGHYQYQAWDSENWNNSANCHCQTACENGGNCRLYKDLNGEMVTDCHCPLGTIQEPNGTGWKCTSNNPPQKPASTYNPADCDDHTLTWTCQNSACDTDVNPGVTYEVYFGTTPDPERVVCPEGTSAKSCTVNILPGQRYFWRVLARDRFSITNESDTFTFDSCSADNDLPTWSSPSLTADTVSAGIELTWPRVSDTDSLTGYAKKYRLFIKEEGSASYSALMDVPAEKYLATIPGFRLKYIGLYPETEYDFKIEACDDYGCTTDGPSVSVETASRENRVRNSEAVDNSNFLSLADRVLFHYYDDDPTDTIYPIQHFVDEDPDNTEPDPYYPIHKAQAALLSGTVSAVEEGTLTSPVLVYVKDHPEYGFTYTRDDGKWDLVVNGGFTYTVRFLAPDYMPVERAIKTSGNMISTIPPVSMTEKGSELGDIIGVNGGVLSINEENRDGRSDRKGMLLVKPNTDIYAVTDGETKKLDSVTIEHREYTNTTDGIKAMPAELPAGIAYTYCVELSIAEAPNAKDIVFTKPVYYYLNNFLEGSNGEGLPVGTAVPSGWYDKDNSRWVASDDGIVLKVVGITNGKADIDMNGDGAADNAYVANWLGLDDNERTQIAVRYNTVGDTFWRMPLRHFSTKDFNLVALITKLAKGPKVEAETPETAETMPIPTVDCGSSIECESQTLGEQIPIPHTPYSLHYRSDQSARRDNKKITLRFNNLDEYGSIPEEDKTTIWVQLQFSIRQIEVLQVNPQPDGTWTWVWDGRDADGVEVNGQQKVHVWVNYGYNAKYSCPGYTIGGRSFGSVSSADSGASGVDGGGQVGWIGKTQAKVCGNAGEQSLTQEFDVVLYSQSTRAQGLGGLTLDVNSKYDFRNKRLFKGDGTVVKADYMEQTVSLVKDGLTNPTDVSALPNGEIVFIENGTSIKKISHTGEIQVVVGGGSRTEYYSGMNPLDAIINAVAMDVDQRGVIYFADNVRKQVLKIEKDGLLYVVAGKNIDDSSLTGVSCNIANRSTSPLELQISSITEVAVDNNGSVYFPTGDAVCKITSDNQVRSLKRMNDFVSVVDAVGHMDVSENGRFLVISGANNNVSSTCSSANIYYIGVIENNKVIKETDWSDCGDPWTPDPFSGEGDIFITYADNDIVEYATIKDDWHNYNMYFFIRRTYNSVLGIPPYENYIYTWNKNTGNLEENVFASQAGINGMFDFTILPSGEIVMAGSSKIRTIGSGIKLFSDGSYMIPDKDTGDLLLFDSSGSQSETWESMTSALKYKFYYDRIDNIPDPQREGKQTVSARVLTGIYDAVRDETTTISRDGNDITIHAPNGMTTTIHVSPTNGFADKVIYPKDISNQKNGGEFSFEYEVAPERNTLLNKIIYPNGRETEYRYNTEGLLERVIDQRTSYLSPFKLLEDTSILKSTKKTKRTDADGLEWNHSYEPGVKEISKIVSGPDGKAENTTKHLDTGYTTEGISSGGVPFFSTNTTEKSDPRFKMLMPYVSSKTVSSGTKSMTVKSERTVSPTSANVFEFNTIEDKITINNKLDPWKVTYYKDDTTKKYTQTSPENRQSQTLVNEFGQPTEFIGPMIGSMNTEITSYDRHDGKLWSIIRGTGGNARIVDFDYYTDEDSGYEIASQSYGFNGYLKKITDPLGRTVDYRYDIMGRIKQFIFMKGDALNERTITYNYDLNGNITGIAPAGKPEHFFVPNEVDLPAAYNPPLANTTTQYLYSAGRLLTDVVRPEGTVHFAYHIDGEEDKDGVSYVAPFTGKLMHIDLPGGKKIAYTYKNDGAKGVDTITTYPTGDILSYEYDGIFLTEEEWGGTTISGSVSYGYNSEFLVSSVTIASSYANLTTNYLYDDDDLMTKAGEMNIVRDGNSGMVTGTTFDGGDVTTAQHYTSFGELKDLSAQKSSIGIFLQEFEEYNEGGTVLSQRDKMGRITYKKEIIDGDEHYYYYDYDVAGRLEKVWQDTPKTQSATTTYGYDQNGNRTSFNGVVIAGYDDEDRLLSYNDITYSYTENGDLYVRRDTKGTLADQSDDKVTTYTHDGLGNLTNVTIEENSATTNIVYRYDGRNRLIAKYKNGILEYRLIYSGQLAPVMKVDSAGQAEIYVYGLNSNVPDYIARGSQRYRVIKDYLGSPRMLVNAKSTDQTIFARLDYDEFGNVAYEEGNFGLLFGFAGGIRDTDTGLTKFGARWYDPETGRWLEKEPLGFKGSFNFYSYAHGDPVNYFDETGLWDAPGHTKLTEDPLRDAGFCDYLVDAAVKANLAVDKWENQDTSHSYMHWVYDKDNLMTPEEYIKQQLALAIKLWPTAPEEAMKALGAGLHTVQDYFAHKEVNQSHYDNISYHLHTFSRCDKINARPQDAKDAEDASRRYINLFLQGGEIE